MKLTYFLRESHIIIATIKINSMKNLIVWSAVLMFFPSLTMASSACYQDPVYEKEGTVMITSDARIRSAACVTNTTVLFTAKKGTTFRLTGTTDGWYRIQDDQGREGWVWDGLSRVVSVQAASTNATPLNTSYISTPADTKFLNQVYDLLTPRDTVWIQNLSTKISTLLVRPSSPRVAFLLTEIQRLSREEIARRKKVTPVEMTQKTPVTPSVTSSNTSVVPPTTPSGTSSQNISSSETTWNIPNVDESRVRATWLRWYNQVRSDLGLSDYRFDAHLDATAKEWSQISKNRGNISHKRDPADASAYNYAAITKWFADRGLVFKNINRVTHTENIGYGTVHCPASGDCTQAFIDGIHSIFAMYMAEKTNPGPWNGAHYKSIINKYFTIIGLGIVMDGNKFYLTVHYGTAFQ